MYLLDTNVLSELRKAGSGKADPNVINWANGVDSDTLFVSVISILELEIGVQRVERRDPAQGRLLRCWLEEQVLTTFDERILPIDLPVAKLCACMHVPNPQSDRDSLIAATAQVYGLTVVTRNFSDFRLTGVALINPWDTTRNTELI